MEYKTVFKQESWGNPGKLGIEIRVASDSMPDMEKDAIYSALHRGAEIIQSEILAEIINNHQDTRAEIDYNRELLSLFPEQIYTEEIPNEYSDGWRYRHLPWFVVTTPVGRFKIGWRKRVIEIDFSDTICRLTAPELFPEENVTKGNAFIHAWSMPDAKRYINVIIEAAKK